MEFLEVFFELLFEFIVDGSIELGSERAVPKPLRIFAAIIVLTVFFGMGGFLIYLGYDAILTGNIGIAILWFVVAAFFIFGGIFLIWKMFRKKSKGR